MKIRTKEESTVEAAVLAGNNGFSLISDEKLRQLYARLVKCRMIEERWSILSGRNGAGAGQASFLGHEAAAVGVAIDLQPEDAIVHSSRDIAASFMKGSSLAQIFNSVSAASVTQNPAGELRELIEMAMSAAQSQKKEKIGRVAAIFFNHESGLSDIWLDAISRAAADRLPILFVCQADHSNGAANAETPVIPEEIALKAGHCGLPAIPVDGSDLVAIYRVATEGLAHARKGNGATFIGCGYSRLGDSPDADPISKMEAYLSRKGLFTEELKREVAAGFSEEIDSAI